MNVLLEPAETKCRRSEIPVLFSQHCVRRARRRKRKEVAIAWQHNEGNEGPFNFPSTNSYPTSIIHLLTAESQLSGAI